ncbi:2-acylglycerol O-acyltransferase 2-A-like isoform X2 [Dermatophagoides pteronyssinus]|uniref:2-acylglycerol O-acyltransferase 2-A-like isoform X2 n=1 Tax=Dermatophagoides pteronyssinus TaxID=6956 RepID=UPI003F673995
MVFGIKFAPFSIPFRRRLQTLAIFLSMYIPFCGIISSIILFRLLYTQYYYITLLYLFWWIFDHETPIRGGRRINWFRNLPIWRLYAEYFPIRLIKTVDIPSNRTNFSKLFPGIIPHLVTINMQFKLPIQRDLFLSAGACSASKESWNYILRRKKGTGNAVCVVIGGAREVLDTIPNTMILTLKNRKGFAREALENGASLVPVISFGENELYQTMHHEEMSTGKKIQEKLYKLLTFTPPLFFGRGVFQYSFGIMPYRKEIFTVVGKPINVERISYPTDAQIDELHEKYIQQVINLYDEHKNKYGYGDIPIKIK